MLPFIRIIIGFVIHWRWSHHATSFQVDKAKI